MVGVAALESSVMPPALHVGPILLLLLLGHVFTPASAVGPRPSLLNPQPLPQQQQQQQIAKDGNTSVGNMKWAVRRLDAPEDSYEHHRHRSSSSADVSECILLFGAFCNGECEQVGSTKALHCAL